MERIFIFLDRVREPYGGPRDDRGEQNHYETQSIDSRREAQVPFWGYRKRRNVLKIVSALVERGKEKQGCCKRQD